MPAETAARVEQKIVRVPLGAQWIVILLRPPSLIHRCECIRLKQGPEHIDGHIAVDSDNGVGDLLCAPWSAQGVADGDDPLVENIDPSMSDRRFEYVALVDSPNDREPRQQISIERVDAEAAEPETPIDAFDPSERYTVRQGREVDPSKRAELFKMVIQTSEGAGLIVGQDEIGQLVDGCRPAGEGIERREQSTGDSRKDQRAKRRSNDEVVLLPAFEHQAGAQTEPQPPGGVDQ
jgi:hypothetical protein